MSLKRFNNINEGTNWYDQIPTGYYVATQSFELTPGGGWSIGIKNNTVLRYDLATKRLESWDALKSEWRTRRPPIQGEEQFSPMSYGGGTSMITKFKQNTKTISKTQAEKLMSEMVKETVIKVKDLEKFIRTSGLSPTDSIKITIM